MHEVDLSDALLLTLGGVEHLPAGLEDAGVHTHEGHLEGQHRQGLVVAGMTLELNGLVTRLVAGDGRHVQWGGQVVDDGVEQRLHALVLEGGTAGHGGEGVGKHATTHGGLDLLDGHRVGVLEVGLHELLVVLGDGLEHLGVSGFGFVLELGRDLLGGVVGTELGLTAPQLGVHLDEVDDALELVLGTHRQLQEHRDGVQTILDGLHGVVEVSSGAVHLVDVADARHAVLGGLTPHGHRLRLDTGHTVEDGDGTVEHTQGTLHLDGEVHVSGGVDDVDLGVVPEGGGGSRRDGDTTLLLLLHPVHGGVALVGLTNLVGLAGVVQDALGRGGLTGIDVCHDADVADVPEVCIGHCCQPRICGCVVYAE